MTNKTYRIAIVGASSLVGKELGDALSESTLGASSFTLLDEEQLAGNVAAAGDEISFIQKIDASSFEGKDLVLFGGAAGGGGAGAAGGTAGSTVSGKAADGDGAGAGVGVWPGGDG